jgi:hypothetical protein
VDLSAVYEGPALVYFWRVYDRLRLVLDGLGGGTEVSESMWCLLPGYWRNTFVMGPWHGWKHVFRPVTFVIGPLRRHIHQASMDLSAVYGVPPLV